MQNYASHLSPSIHPSRFIKCNERQILWPTMRRDTSSFVPLFSPRMQIRGENRICPHKKQLLPPLRRKLPLCLSFFFIQKSWLPFLRVYLRSDHCAGSQILPVTPQCGFFSRMNPARVKFDPRCSAIMSACSALFHTSIHATAHT